MDLKHRKHRAGHRAVEIINFFPGKYIVQFKKRKKNFCIQSILTSLNLENQINCNIADLRFTVGGAVMSL